MKNLGKVEDKYDCTTKEYVDGIAQHLNETKLEKSDFTEYSENDVETTWNKYMKN